MVASRVHTMTYSFISTMTRYYQFGLEETTMHCHGQDDGRMARMVQSSKISSACAGHTGTLEREMLSSVCVPYV